MTRETISWSKSVFAAIGSPASGARVRLPRQGQQPTNEQCPGLHASTRRIITRANTPATWFVWLASFSAPTATACTSRWQAKVRSRGHILMVQGERFSTRSEVH